MFSGIWQLALAYLGILQACPLRSQIVNDTFTCIWKCDSTDKQNEKHNIWEGCSEIHHLGIKNIHNGFKTCSLHLRD